jgi:DNA-directed RNA polymerase specialized sigma24 family protein
MSDGHPFKHLEPQLQRICELWLPEKKRGAEELRELIEKINPFVKLAASQILSSPRLRHFRRSADDAVQQWWMVMLKAGFKQYAPDRGPLFPYAYKTLSRICVDGTRGPRGKRVYPLVIDCADQRKPAPPSGIKEKGGMQWYVAVRELPFNYRRAILLKHWFEKSAAEGAARCGISVPLYHTWVFQGHERLRERFGGSDRPDAA